MRNVISISLSDELLKELEREVKAGKFASKSEYIRHMMWERRTAKSVRQSQKEFAEGKGKILRSFADLD